MSTCAIIGAGLGGCALLAGMALKGYTVRLMLGRDLTKPDGRTLPYLGLAGKTVAQIRQIFQTGGSV